MDRSGDKDVSSRQRPTARGSSWRRSSWRRAAKRLLTIVVVFYLMVIVLMIFLENFLVYPGATFGGGDWQPTGMEYEDAFFASDDGTQLHGWYCEHSSARAHVLLCHGNGENVAQMRPFLDELRAEYQISVFAFDYRGYGRSEGKPHEAGVIADGHAAQAWLAQRAGIEPDQVVILGRSLGGGVAVDLAARNGARGLVLERTFTSLPDAAARLYPWIPVRLLMRNKFDSLSKMSQYAGPLLQSHGTSDTIVPFDLGQQLFAASPSDRKHFVAMPGVGHNGPSTFEYLAALQEFFQALSTESMTQ